MASKEKYLRYDLRVLLIHIFPSHCLQPFMRHEAAKNCLRSKKAADSSSRNMGMAVQPKYMKVG
jgi:hypothetical protein